MQVVEVVKIEAFVQKEYNTENANNYKLQGHHLTSRALTKFNGRSALRISGILVSRS